MTTVEATVRVQKLLALAEGTNFPHERQSAAWLAADVSNRYGLNTFFFERLWSVLRCGVLENLCESMKSGELRTEGKNERFET